MKKNEELQKEVYKAINLELFFNTTEIGVFAKNGIITLIGVVDSSTKKTQIEETVKNVTGVKAVVEKIEIKYSYIGINDDNKIAIGVLHAFKWSWKVPSDKIKVKVEDGYITLEGELQWDFQKEAAKRLVKNLTGVKGVTNIIKIKSETRNQNEKYYIKQAIIRNLSINDQVISVNT